MYLYSVSLLEKVKMCVYIYTLFYFLFYLQVLNLGHLFFIFFTIVSVCKLVRIPSMLSSKWRRLLCTHQEEGRVWWEGCWLSEALKCVYYYMTALISYGALGLQTCLPSLDFEQLRIKCDYFMISNMFLTLYRVNVVCKC